MPTRSDLRDEFAMDDVFALSPISARPAQPSEADYEAIRDAFMETSRGRWFLGEYAKRNRNADTSMVLDAVARIEQALAAQQRLQQLQEQQEAENGALPEALAAIRHALTGAEGAAAVALDHLALEQNLAPVRKGIRIIKEISWRWREIGADSRICDLIDSQVVAIEAACDHIAGTDPRAALIAAFDLIRAQLDALDGTAATPTADMAEFAEALAASSAPAGDEIAPPAEPVSVPAAQDAHVPSAAAVPPTAATVAAPRAPEAGPAAEDRAAAAPAAERSEMAPPSLLPSASDSAETPAFGAPTRPASVTPAPAQVAVEPVKPGSEGAAVKSERVQVAVEAALSADDDDMDIIVVSKAEADAQDDAILELVAAEMADHDSPADKEFAPTSTIHFDIEDPNSVDDDIIATFAEPAPPQPEAKPAQRTSVVAPPSPMPEPRPVSRAPEPHVAVMPKPSPLAPAPAIAPPAAASAMPAPAPAPTVQQQPRPAPAVQMPVTPAPAVQEQPKPTTAAALHPLPKPIPQPSLGATLLANGLLQRPIAANDPLTPIRRMTQPEKIAFFS